MQRKTKTNKKTGLWINFTAEEVAALKAATTQFKISREDLLRNALDALLSKVQEKQPSIITLP